MFLNANADGVVYVIAPTKFANIARLTPFARIFVGKISNFVNLHYNAIERETLTRAEDERGSIHALYRCQ